MIGTVNSEPSTNLSDSLESCSVPEPAARHESPQAGRAELNVALVCGQSATTSAYATSPLRLLIPRPRGPSVWVYCSNFGGGLVAGDQTRIDLRVERGARCFTSTQASTKVYKNPDRLPCSHVTQCMVEEDALLVFAPDVMQAFADSSYRQHQQWFLAKSAGLVLLDWFGAGRPANGERWAFQRLQSRNDVFVANERVFTDSVCLDAADETIGSPYRTGRFDCFALLLTVGPQLERFTEDLFQDYSSRPIQRRASLVWSVSRIRGGTLLRLAGENTEEVGAALRQRLQRLSTHLGADPWQRRT